MFSYAQNNEDVLLARVFAGVENGFYVDVGANDPVHDSVTKHFYDQGWTGINIEASPAWFAKITEQRPKDINLNVAASDRSGEITFYELNDSGLSTTIERFADRGVERGFRKNTYTVKALTLNEILDNNCSSKDIHFLKIDVEGAEKSVLMGIDFNKYRPWVVVVEATEPLTNDQTHNNWDHLISGFHYSFTVFDGLNRWYLAEEHLDLAPLLSCNADKYEWIGNFWTRGYLQSELEKAQAELARLRDALAELSKSVHI